MKFDNLTKRPEESEIEYKKRVYLYRDLYGLTWQDIADIINEELDLNYSSDKYRKESYSILDKTSADVLRADDKLLEIKKEKVKLSDQRIQINSLIRKLARDEVFKDLAIEAAEEVSSKKFLDIPEKIEITNEDKKAILCIGDWHYGLDVSLYFNEYSREIATKRVGELLERVLKIIDEHSINELYVVNLGDMISGRIHLPLRINSRIDTVQQTMEVSEILAEFLSELTHHTNVIYVSVLDNHSRVEPNKKESIQTESFARIIDWYLQERLKNNNNFYYLENKFSEDIAIFDVFNHIVVAVHGDKDPQKGIIEKLNSYLGGHIDLILSAHRHHFSADENDTTEFYCNGSLIGQDDFAEGLRLNSKPSQLMFICTPENFSEIIYKIKL